MASTPTITPGAIPPPSCAMSIGLPTGAHDGTTDTATNGHHLSREHSRRGGDRTSGHDERHPRSECSTDLSPGRVDGTSEVHSATMSVNHDGGCMTDKIDRAALRARYLQERDKRLRSDGNEQYVELTGQFAHYLDDPYATAEPREPLFDEVTVAFIGGGFSGLVTGAKLKQAGIDDVRIIEKGGDFGGTWYWNRYPGAQCDTAAFVYLPLLEETGHMPTEKYVHAPEILEHCRNIGRTFDLYDNAMLSTEVTGLDWDDDASRWIIRTNRGDETRARFVVMGPGPLHRPKLPGIPGIETFEGYSFHTSRWDYEYTGGDPAGAPMTNLADRRVGIIGTGATAVQCVPHLANASGRLYVFQRTPSSIDVRNNLPTDPDWFATLEPGWQQRWLENFTILQTGGFADEDLVQDGWTDISQRIRDKLFESDDHEFTPAAVERAYHDSDDEKMTEIRARVDEIVDDEITAEKLKPWYRQLCKRPCFHDEYLQAFNNPSTQLVDTDGKGVDRIDETGVWVGDDHYELDLPDLRVGVRGRHRIRASSRVRCRAAATDCRSARSGPTACSACTASTSRLPEPVPRRADARRQPDLEHPAQSGRGGRDHRHDHRSRAGDRRRRGGGHRRIRSGMGRAARSRTTAVRRQPRLHARLLQQRGSGFGSARCPQPARLPRRPRRLLPVHRRMAELGPVRRTRVPMSVGSLTERTSRPGDRRARRRLGPVLRTV